MRKRNQGSSLEKFSVTKPFTILVAVIAVIAMSLVSLGNITTDLLPEFGLPYLLVITTYPGASPEKVEEQVGKPMERTLGTVSGVKNVYTVNAENYCMTQLEFEEGTDMDSAMVRVSEQLGQASGLLPDMCGTPSLLELSLDMVATTYIAVNYEGYNIYQLSDFVSDEVVPYLERQEGVANVNEIGLVEKSIHVDLNQKKIDALNDRILEKVNEGLEDARKTLDDARKQVEEGQAALEESEAVFGNTVSSALFSQIDSVAEGAAKTIKSNIFSLISMLENMSGIISAADNIGNEAESEMNSISSAITDARNELSEITATRAELQKTAQELETRSRNPRLSLKSTVNRALKRTLLRLQMRSRMLRHSLKRSDRR